MNYLLGIDIGGTSVKGVAVTPGGNLVQRYHEPFDLDQPMGFASAADAILKQASERLGTPQGIGISAPGIAGREGRFIDFMPGRFEGLEKLDWGNRFGRFEGVPVLNDAHAALLGEVWQGAARDAQDAVLLTLGTGVGGAILSEGRLLRGHAGKGGHLGHMSLDPDGLPDICNAPGSLESAMGNLNISERSGGRFETTLEMIQAHENGDSDATRVWMRSVKSLAAAIASLGNILDPEIVILGGGISRSGPALLNPLEQFLDSMEWRPGGRRLRLALAQLGDLAGAYGAAHQCLRQVSPAQAQPNFQPGR